MKYSLATILSILALAVGVQAADTTVTISKVHLCCKKCVTGVETAVGAVDGAKVKVDKDADTVELSGPDKATVQ
jgi:mercuric ion binding protein